ncbi:MAG: cob(I)yrinic acid a,c-diamide adenosyltransferase [Firmicutes bacterium]|nr:cob(I)yrinic acid a,c-diamide adenosyltransferase [Bacillota bacterium]
MEKFQGLIQVYTGDGKGKTTAALGQGLRAAGRGFKVTMVQFLKGRDTGEIESVKAIENFNIHRFEESKKFIWNMNEEEINELKGKIEKAYNFIYKEVESNNCDILILDEILGVLNNDLISLDKILDLLKIKPDDVEIILTGRNIPNKLKEKANLVTEMKMIKHPFQEGIHARYGIEY